MQFGATRAQNAIRLTDFEIWSEAFLISMIVVAAGGGVYLLLRRLMPFQAGQRPALDPILVIGSFTLPFLAHLAIGRLSRGASRAFFGLTLHLIRLITPRQDCSARPVLSLFFWRFRRR